MKMNQDFFVFSVNITLLGPRLTVASDKMLRNKEILHVVERYYVA